jgi:hypothetical protein
MLSRNQNYLTSMTGEISGESVRRAQFRHCPVALPDYHSGITGKEPPPPRGPGFEITRSPQTRPVTEAEYDLKILAQLSERAQR